MKMYKYAVIMFNFNNYETFKEPLELDPDCEYVYVTDNTKLKSNKWKIIVDNSLNGKLVFEKCFYVRYNLFKYTNAPVAIYMDGSFQIYKSLKPIYDSFIESNADLGICIHPYRNEIFAEYTTWVNTRNYSVENVKKVMKIMAELNYPTHYKGLYQAGMRICKNTELNKTIDTEVFKTLKKLSTPNSFERLDQTIYSIILNSKYENKIKIFPFAQQVFQSNLIRWKIHGTNKNHPAPLGNYKTGYVFNKEVNLFNLIDLT